MPRDLPSQASSGRSCVGALYLCMAGALPGAESEPLRATGLHGHHQPPLPTAVLQADQPAVKAALAHAALPEVQASDCSGAMARGTACAGGGSY